MVRDRWSTPQLLVTWSVSAWTAGHRGKLGPGTESARSGSTLQLHGHGWRQQGELVAPRQLGMGPRQRGQLVDTQLLGHRSQWAETPGQPRVGLNPGSSLRDSWSTPSSLDRGPSSQGQLIDPSSARKPDQLGWDSWLSLCLLGQGTESAGRALPPPSSWDPRLSRPRYLVDPKALRIRGLVGRDSWSTRGTLAPGPIWPG